jgi:hypothetical protein
VDLGEAEEHLGAAPSYRRGVVDADAGGRSPRFEVAGVEALALHRV